MCGIGNWYGLVVLSFLDRLVHSHSAHDNSLLCDCQQIHLTQYGSGQISSKKRQQLCTWEVDSRFQDVFGVTPSYPQKKKTEGMKRLLLTGRFGICMLSLFGVREVHDICNKVLEFSEDSAFVVESVPRLVSLLNIILEVLFFEFALLSTEVCVYVYCKGMKAASVLEHCIFDLPTETDPTAFETALMKYNEDTPHW